MEDSTASEGDKTSEKADDEDSLSNEDTINALLERFDRNRLSRSHVEPRKND